MQAYIFPGQGAQFAGMGKDLYEQNAEAKALFDKANDVLGFDLVDIMFNGSDDDLKQTKVTQPAIFLHSVTMALGLPQPKMAAGHSLGEFSALVAVGCLQFEDALTLVSKRANAMQKACEINPSTMAAILGLDDVVVADVCASIDDVVVPANYNCPGQIVISGTHAGIDLAIKQLTEKGARRAIKLPVGGAFHSPLMEMAREELAQAITETEFKNALCPIYQNVNAQPATDADEIKNNLISQLTAPVLWTQTMQQMLADGCQRFTEVGPGKVLLGLLRKIDRSVEAVSAA